MINLKFVSYLNLKFANIVLCGLIWIYMNLCKNMMISECKKIYIFANVFLSSMLCYK